MAIIPPGSRPKTPVIQNSKQGPKDMMSDQRSPRASSSAGSKVNIVELLFERNLGHCVLRVFLALDGQTLKCARCVCRRWAKFISNEVQHSNNLHLDFLKFILCKGYVAVMRNLKDHVSRFGVGHSVTWREDFITSGASTCLGYLESSTLPGTPN